MEIVNKTDMIARAEELVRGVSRLPTIPEISLRVSSLLENPDVDIQKVADLILSDQVLTAQVLRTVNSPFFKPLLEITSLRHAVVYLGLSRIREIVLTCSLVKVFTGGDADYDIRTFWHHSFGVGIMARKMARLLSIPGLDTAYTAGIVHNIGEVLLSTQFRRDWGAIVRLVREEEAGFLDAELRTLGTTHCEIGLCLARQWHFPEAYCDVIAYHHAPAEAPRNQVLAALVNLADIFYTVGMGLAEEGEWARFTLSDEAAWAIMKGAMPALADFDVERFSFELQEEMPEIRKLVRDLFV